MNRLIKLMIIVTLFGACLPIPGTFAAVETLWKVSVSNIEFKNEMFTTEDIVLYTGDIQKIEHRNKPNSGNQYVFVRINAEKVGSGNQIFSSSQIRLIAKEKEYKRIDDSFLHNYGMVPFPTYNLEVGKKEGVIVFEIPRSFTSENIIFQYKGKEVPVSFEKEQDNDSRIDIINSNVSISDGSLEEQWSTEQRIIKQFNEGNFTIQNPLVVQDPYDFAPLTALIMFKTKTNAKVAITIEGKDQFTTVRKSFNGYGKIHEIPVVGLYPNKKNKVMLTIYDQDNNKTTTQTLYIQTEKLPDYYISTDVKLSDSANMERGFTFLSSEGQFHSIIDSTGEFRWYSQYDSFLIFKRLKNGRMLITDNKSVPLGKQSLFEIDLLGKIYNEYYVPGGVHHDAIELPNGNLLVTNNNDDGQYVEDSIIEIDRKTGQIVNTIDIRKHLDIDRFQKKGNKDWFHNNAIWYDESDKSIIISGAYQNAIVKMDYPSGAVRWILASPSGWNTKLKGLLLNPIDSTLEWPRGQHSPMILPDQDNDPSTTDLLLFDNNYDRSGKSENSRKEIYSRAVQYRINEDKMTVEQRWQYGEERAEKLYSKTVGDADYLPKTGNRLVTFGDLSGGRLTKNTSHIIEVSGTQPAKAVFELEISFPDNRRIYRAERLPLYPETWNVGLGRLKGTSFKPSTVKNNAPILMKDELIKSDTIVKSLDSIRISGNELNVFGWAIIKGASSSLINTSVLLSSGNNFYVFKTNVINRPDVTTYFNDGTKYDGSGLDLKDADLTGLPHGKYEIGMLMEFNGKKYYQLSDKFFTIKEPLEAESTTIKEKTTFIDQASLNNELEVTFSSNDYSIQKPLLIENPYKVAPLTALMMFKTPYLAQATVKVSGKEESVNVVYKIEGYSKEHRIPIVGLYPGVANEVIIEIANKNGKKTSYTHWIKTDPLPSSIKKGRVVEKKPEEMQEGFTFLMMRDGLLRFIDENGDVRYYLNDKVIGRPFTALPNGHLLVSSTDPKNIQPFDIPVLWEMDLLGQVHKAYYLPMGGHNEIIQTPSGLSVLFATQNDPTLQVKNDVIAEMDLQTGKIVKEFDYKDKFDKDLSMGLLYTKRDWYYINSIGFDRINNDIVNTARSQNAIVARDYSTGEIEWILSPYKYEGSLARKQLKPIGDTFEYPYGAHNVTVLPDMDNNVRTAEFSVYDNGNYRSLTKDGALSAQENYSRGVIYQVDLKAMTIKQLWEYGKTRGSDLYTPNIGGFELQPNGNRLLTFGGNYHEASGRKSESPAAPSLGGRGYGVVVETNEKGEVVFEYSLDNGQAGLNETVYRAMRVPMYPNGWKFNSVRDAVQILGDAYSSLPVDSTDVTGAIQTNKASTLHSYIQQSVIYFGAKFDESLVPTNSSVSGIDKGFVKGAYLLFQGLNGKQYRFRMDDNKNQFSAMIDLKKQFFQQDKYRIYVEVITLDDKQYIYNTNEIYIYRKERIPG